MTEPQVIDLMAALKASLLTSQCQHADPFVEPMARICSARATHRVQGAGHFCELHALRYASRWSILSGVQFTAVPL